MEDNSEVQRKSRISGPMSSLAAKAQNGKILSASIDAIIQKIFTVTRVSKSPESDFSVSLDRTAPTDLDIKALVKQLLNYNVEQYKICTFVPADYMLGVLLSESTKQKSPGPTLVGVEYSSASQKPKDSLQFVLNIMDELGKQGLEPSVLKYDVEFRFIHQTQDGRPLTLNNVVEQCVTTLKQSQKKLLRAYILSKVD